MKEEEVAVLIPAIREKANERPPGYFEDYMRRGRVVGDFLLLRPSEAKKLAKIYHPRGAGTYFKLIIKPVVWAVDGVAGTDLQNCPPCKLREIKANLAWNRFWTEGFLARAWAWMRSLRFPLH